MYYGDLGPFKDASRNSTFSSKRFPLSDYLNVNYLAHCINLGLGLRIVLVGFHV